MHFLLTTILGNFLIIYIFSILGIRLLDRAMKKDCERANYSYEECPLFMWFCPIANTLALLLVTLALIIALLYYFFKELGKLLYRRNKRLKGAIKYLLNTDLE